ncbi:MAG: hypothetical protein LC797_23370 [Chloroflexi bacterium]|nr:hypothetical protein [Chloroflexota bacterium]
MAVVSAMWWPLMPLAVVGSREIDIASRAFLVAALVAGVFLLKQGTFFNVLDPAEPFLAVAAAGGVVELRRRAARKATAVVSVCLIGLALHVVSVVNGAMSRALPFPVGGGFLSTDNEEAVDLAVQAIERRSKPGRAVLVNPFLAVLAHRHETKDQADWFLLYALGHSCNSQTNHRCRLWLNIKAAAKYHSGVVVSVDTNVTSFDAHFSYDTGISSMQRLFSVDQPPLYLTLFARR